MTNIEKINAKSKMTQVSRPRIKLIAQFGVFSLKQFIYLQVVGLTQLRTEGHPLQVTKRTLVDNRLIISFISV